MSHETEIIQAMSELGKHCIVDEIHQKTGILKETIHRILTKMHKNGTVERNFKKFERHNYVPVHGRNKRHFVWSLKQ